MLGLDSKNILELLASSSSRLEPRKCLTTSYGDFFKTMILIPRDSPIFVSTQSSNGNNDNATALMDSGNPACALDREASVLREAETLLPETLARTAGGRLACRALAPDAELY